MPVFADVARSWSEGHLPLLSPYSWVCSNLAGEFQYGTFSIFVNAAVVFDLEIPAHISATSRRAFDDAFVRAGDGRVSARARTKFERSRFRRWSHSLRRLTAGSCAGARPIGSARSVRGPGCRGHGGDWNARSIRRRGPWRFLWPAPFVYLLVTGGFPYTVGMLAVAHRVARSQVVRHDKKNIASVSDVFWHSAWPWPFGSGVAGLDRLHPRLGPTTRSGVVRIFNGSCLRPHCPPSFCRTGR